MKSLCPILGKVDWIMSVLLRMMGGGGTDEVFYNFTGTKVTKLKVNIEKAGYYGLAYINGNISKDKPTIIDWGNDTKTTLTTPIIDSTQVNDLNVNYYKPGEYVISIDGLYNYFKCYGSDTNKPGVTQIYEVLTEVIQVSSLITNFDSVFNRCTSLTSIPAGLFDNNTTVTNFRYTFLSCSNLKKIPTGLFDKNTEVTSFQGTFCFCSSLTSIPAGLFDKNTNATNFSQTFQICPNLASIPSGLFDNNTRVTDFGYAFDGCSSLTSIPSGLFDNNTRVTDFARIFSGCSKLACETPYTKSSDGKNIKLWQRNGTNGFAQVISTIGAFNGCKNLTDYNDIPTSWK